MSLNEQLATYFKARPGEWLDGRVLSKIAGCYAWRSRCADIRRLFNMRIDNRQRRVTNAEGKPFTVSEYCYVVEAEPDLALTVNAEGQSSFL